MANKQSDERAVPRRSWRARAAGAGFLLALALTGAASAQAQTIRVSGTVQSAGGTPIPGAAVRIAGTDTAVTTNTNGRYTINAPANGILSFTLIGYRAQNVPVQSRSTIDVTMERLAILEQVVVTAYSQEQERGQITGAVSSVNMEAASKQTSASVLQRMDATVAGVTVQSTGSPGSRSTVRIRGISSFQNNDPLYIIDGTPVQDSYVNFLNPNDIASIQVLKDASAASIYGSRASNGVVIIETTKGSSGAPRATLRLRTGITDPVKGYDDILMQSSADYARVVATAYTNAKLPVTSDFTNLYGSAANPTIPQYIWCGHNPPCTSADVDAAKYSYPSNLIMPASQGTDWWSAVFGTGAVNDANLDVSGGTGGAAYTVSFNYFNQKGTAIYNNYNRGSVRVNTSFDRSRLTVGENIAVTTEKSVGGLGDDSFGEGGILGKNILMQPIVPVRDIEGNFASGKATSLGNNTNPVKLAYTGRDNSNRNDRVFGNVFGSYNLPLKTIFRSQFGFNVGQGQGSGFTDITPENSEATLVNSIYEYENPFREWTFSNTMRGQWIGGPHNLQLLLGQEANHTQGRGYNAGLSGLISTDINARFIQDALGDASSKNVSSSGYETALLSYFGKADYTLLDRYVLSATLRRDGSSNLGPDHRWGTFPAFGFAWKTSDEPFFPKNDFVSNMQLRVGYGVTGNQQIPSGRIVAQYGGGTGDTYYDITGSNSSIVAGYRETALGNSDLKWEENRSINVGTDLSLYRGWFDVVFDAYRRNTNNLLFDPLLPATGGVASQPIVNIGEMRNTGFDFSVGHHASAWSLTFNGSHYKNEIIRIDGSSNFFYGPSPLRISNQIINEVGHPIGSFYGFVSEGFFKDAADVAAHATQDGALPGRIKFKDVNGDGKITLADETIIGSPHPDFTAGLDFDVRRGRFDLSATVFGTYGNDIFDAQKDFYVFRDFSTNVRKDLLTNSWTPADPSVPRSQYTAKNPNAKYPIIDQGDTYSRQPSSYYVEDGSYTRLRNLQLGYSLPSNWLRGVQTARVYVQGENLFTITGYEGLDPALTASNISGAAGDIRDQYRGVDRGTYPSNRTFSLGVTTSF